MVGMREYEVKYQGKTYQMYGHEPTEYISSYLNKGVFYEEPLLSYIYKTYPNLKTVIDIGANIGNHTVFFNKVIGAKVIAFEPADENMKILHQYMSETVLLERVALSDHVGRAIPHINPGNMGATWMEPALAGSVEVLTLDNYHEKDIDLIKIDAENMEVKVIHGALETIMRCKPVLFVEHHDLKQHYDFVRALNRTEIPYLVRPFVKYGWEMFEYIPVEKL